MSEFSASTQNRKRTFDVWCPSAGSKYGLFDFMYVLLLLGQNKWLPFLYSEILDYVWDQHLKSRRKERMFCFPPRTNILHISVVGLSGFSLCTQRWLEWLYVCSLSAGPNSIFSLPMVGVVLADWNDELRYLALICSGFSGLSFSNSQDWTTIFYLSLCAWNK